MGKGDIQTLNYFEDNKRFADLVNGALFCGEQVIVPEKLMEANKELLFTQDEKGKKAIRDNVKKYFENILICIYVMEHQRKIDYHMVVRNMLNEALEYHRQWSEMKKKHKEKGDLKDGNEIISGMKKTDKFVPVITLVAYYGEEKWDAATCLHELLELESISPALLSYVENYHIHVFDYHDYDNFDMFQTELKQIFSFIKGSFDKKVMKEYVAAHKEEYYNISKEGCELLAAITHSKELLHLEEYRDQTKGEVNMCRALEEIRLEGIEEGINAFVIDYLEEGFTKEKILFKLQNRFSLSEEKAESYFERFAPKCLM